MARILSKIHHATAKLATRLGITLEVKDDEVVAILDGEVIARGADGKTALDIAKEQIAEETSGDDERDGGGEEQLSEGRDDAEGDVDEESDEDSGRSIVKAKYKVAYRPFKQTCGDSLAQRISAAIKVAVTVTLSSGKTKKVLRIDPRRLQRLAQMNGVWSDEYLKLNVGQQRMNCGNRLRKIEKDGKEIRGL